MPRPLSERERQRSSRSARPSNRAASTDGGSGAGVPLFLQAKLRIDGPGDRYEREADVVAARVARGEHAPPISTITSASEGVQRKCACEASGEPCDHCAAEHEEEEQTDVQRKAVNGSGASTDVSSGATPGLDAAALQGSAGQPLGASTRGVFEARFGRDFSSVRVHEGGNVSLTARQIGAQAFTHGRDIYFAAGEYQPTDEAGRVLLAHELTHVVQQGGAETDVSSPPKP